MSLMGEFLLKEERDDFVVIIPPWEFREKRL